MNILLDYFFPITSIEPTPAASTAFLKQVAIVCSPIGMAADAVTLCTTPAEVAAVTANTEATQLFNAGMSRVYVITADTLDIATLIEPNLNDFYTILVSSDFNDTAIDARDFGAFAGVVGLASTDGAKNTARAILPKTSAWFKASGNGSKNMFFAFGKLLSASVFRNQQYITMPFDDDVDTLGEAIGLFDDKISFVLYDDEFGKRLGLFAAGSKAIVAPYITRNLEIDMQSAALSYISGNQPAYTLKQAALIEDELQKVIQSYIDRELITAGTVSITLVNDNFVATGNINISEPNALWRIEAEMRQTL